MADKEAIIGIGIWRRRDNILGECVEVRPMQWSERDGRPIGVGSRYELPHLDDLEFSGYVSDYMSGDSKDQPDWPYYYGNSAEYRPHRVDLRKAKVMSDFLAKIDRAIAKAEAHEAGDRFMVFAQLCKAKHVWMPKGPDHTITPWPGHTAWIELSVTRGRDYYRDLIRDAREATRAKLLGKEAA